LSSLFKDLAKVFMEDARFEFRNLEKHYNKHMNEFRDLPLTMTMKEYGDICYRTSIKQISPSVLAYSYSNGRTAKYDKSENWFVSYAGDALVTGFPLRGGESRFLNVLMKESHGKQLFK